MPSNIKARTATQPDCKKLPKKWVGHSEYPQEQLNVVAFACDEELLQDGRTPGQHLHRLWMASCDLFFDHRQFIETIVSLGDQSSEVWMAAKKQAKEYETVAGVWQWGDLGGVSYRWLEQCQ